MLLLLNLFKEEYMDSVELGRQIQLKRKDKKISQTKLAEITGVSRNYISIIERGEAHNISMKVINQMAVALGVSLAELTGEQSIVMIPPLLRELGIKNNMTYEMVDTLARIPRRGKEPKSLAEWESLYNAISQFIEPKNGE
jgi:transcriptional regulator with XRE-family HTH domain